MYHVGNIHRHHSAVSLSSTYTRIPQHIHTFTTHTPHTLTYISYSVHVLVTYLLVYMQRHSDVRISLYAVTYPHNAYTQSVIYTGLTWMATTQQCATKSVVTRSVPAPISTAPAAHRCKRHAVSYHRKSPATSQADSTISAEKYCATASLAYPGRFRWPRCRACR